MAARKKLASRLFAALFVFSFVAMLAATIAAMAASYSSYESEEEAHLLSQAQQFAKVLDKQNDTNAVEALENIPIVNTRATLIDADGTVLYDSQVDASALENHSQRTEFKEAKESGQGVVMRRSDTLGADTLYAAVQLGDGSVLRLAESRASLASFLGGAAWQLGISLVVIFLVSLLLSRIVTRMVVRPLVSIDLAHPLENDAYAEVQPLLARVDLQRRELEDQNEELQHAVTLRRDFTGNVSHEMKTPLQVIGGYAELIENGVVSAEDLPHIAGLIREESNTMRELVDDVLTLSKLDESAGPGEPVLIREVCDRVAGRLELAAEEKHVNISLDCCEAIVVGTPSMIEQMVYNLVDNAIKYSPEGAQVFVSCETYVANDGANTVRLCVQDEGPGIPDEAKERVFERFFRLDSSRSRETGGTGLGLAIVKHVAESSNGLAYVKDAPGGGSIFVVELPCA